MSYLPCSNCRNTAGVRLKYVYLTHFKGEERISTRAKLCEPCFEALLSDLLNVCERQGTGGQWLAQEQQL